MDAIPTPRQELERKTVEYLEAQINRADNNRLERRDLHVIGRALWNITSGLVDDDIANLCSMTAAAGQNPRIARRYVGKGKVLIIMWTPDGQGYVVLSVDATTQIKSVLLTSKSEVGIREEELRTLFGTLSKSGYIEIN